MALFYLLFIFVYAWLLWSMKGHWQGRGILFSREKAENNMSILVPFRNESKQLPDLLLNLENTLLPSQEVVFINDDSHDGSGGLIASFIQNKNLDNWVLLDNAGIGKKAALTTGVNYTQADIILTTDADCILPPHWPDLMGQAFAHEELQLVAGPVMTLSQPGFFARFQQIEWASLLLMTQYFFSKKQPLMCSGANLAYRKSAFISVEGYRGNERHPSGDDEFLLKKILQNYGANSVAYLQGREVLVKTQPLPDWSSFLQQRTRWAGKWRLHGSIRHALPAVLAFILALIVLSTVWLLFGSVGSKLVFIVFWTVKIGFEKNVLGKVLAGYNLGHSLFHYIGTAFLHPVYVLTVGIRAIIGKYSWKGRINSGKF